MIFKAVLNHISSWIVAIQLQWDFLCLGWKGVQSLRPDPLQCFVFRSFCVYGASEGLHTLLVEREAPGGQAGMSSNIENYLGFPTGLTGANLARRAVGHAARFGAEMLAPQETAGIRIDGPYRFVNLSDDTEISCHTLLIATGVSALDKHLKRRY